MKIKGLKKVYKTGTDVLALNGISFDLPERGMVFLLGKSGSGKSTLLNILSGLDSFDEGCVEVNGKNLKDFSARELENYRNHICGIVFQDYNLLPELNVKENIALSLEFQGEKNTDQKVKEVLNQVELSGYERRKVKELSGGQKQRVAIARAIIKDPEIVFADEPTGALDEETGRGILSLMKELSKDRLIVVVSHDEEFAREYGDRIIELSDGKVISDSNPLSGFVVEEKPLEVKKTRLPFKAAFKVGCGNFKFHPIRLIATVLIAVISFACLAVSLNIATCDTVESYAKAMYDNLQCTEIHKEEYYLPDGYYDGSLDRFLGNHSVSSKIAEISESDIEEIEEISKTSVVRFQTYRNAQFDYFQLAVVDGFDRLKDLTKTDPQHFGLYATGLAIVDEETCETYGLTVTGRLPQNSSEVAINECMLNIYLECGLMDGGEAFEINSAEDIFGHQIPLDEPDYTTSGKVGYYTVTGVVNTGCSKNCSHMVKNGDYFLSIKDYFHEKIFVHESYVTGYEFVVCPISSDYKTFSEFTNFAVGSQRTAQAEYKNHAIGFSLSNPYSSGYNLSFKFATMIKFGCLYLSVIFFVISLLLLTNFIATLIRGQMKEIGILTSMGANFWQIIFIYVLSALIPCGAVFLLSSAAMFGGVGWFNSWLMSESGYHLAFRLISYHPVPLFILLALSVLTAFLGSLLPLLKMRKMSSAEIIRKGQIK